MSNAFFMSVVVLASALHNFYKLIDELKIISEKGGIELYVVLMILSGVLALAGLFLMWKNKKSAAFVLLGAATVAISEHYFGLDPFYSLLWAFCYDLVGGACFYQINIGMKMPEYAFMTKRKMLQKAMETLADSEQLMKDQGEWNKRILAFMKTYGVLTYYAYITVYIFCLLTPLVYLYMSMNKITVENIYYEGAKWTLLLCAILIGIFEFQRKNKSED